MSKEISSKLGSVPPAVTSSEPVLTSRATLFVNSATHAHSAPAVIVEIRILPADSSLERRGFVVGNARLGFVAGVERAGGIPGFSRDGFVAGFERFGSVPGFDRSSLVTLANDRTGIVTGSDRESEA
jgi:hypothetical protein